MDHQQILSNFCHEVVHSFILLPVSRCNVLLYGAMLFDIMSKNVTNLAMNMCDAVEVPGNCERLVCVVPKDFTLGGYLKGNPLSVDKGDKEDTEQTFSPFQFLDYYHRSFDISSH